MDVAIVQCVRNLGVDIDEDVDDIGALDDRQLFACVVRLCWVLRPESSTRIVSAELSPNVLQRIRAAQALVDVIDSIGYRRAIGYQQLLYGSVDEMRALLVFLCEAQTRMTTRESDGDMNVVKEDMSSWRGVLTAASHHVRDDSTPSWTPIYCRRMRMRYRQRQWHTATTDEHVPWRPTIIDSASIQHLPASLLVDARSPTKHVVQTATITAPMLPPKPKRATLERHTVDGEEAVVDDDGADRVRELHARLGQLGDTVTSRRGELDELTSRSAGVRETNDARAADWKAHGARLLALLRHPDTTVQRLIDVETKSDAKYAKLSAQWSTHREGRMVELARVHTLLDDRRSMHAQHDRTLLDDARMRLDDIREDIADKAVFLEHLRTRASKVRTGASRSSYTRRIVEMIASVGRQREAIERVLADNVLAQRHLRTVEGRLERAHMACRLAIGLDAVDALSRDCLTALASVQDVCNAQLGAIEACANTRKRMETLKCSIDEGRQGEGDDKLARLVDDYSTVKAENDAIQSRLSAV